MNDKITNFLFSYAVSWAALTRLWLGDWVMRLPVFIVNGLGVFAAFIIFCAYAGLCIWGVRKKSTTALTLLLLSMAPVFVFLFGIDPHLYQFYKALLSVSPLFILGVLLLWRNFYWQYPKYKVVLQSLAITGGSLLLMITSLVTLTAAWQTSELHPTLFRYPQFTGFLINPATKRLQQKLSSLKNKNILISWNASDYGKSMMNGWLVYFARKNNVWLSNKFFGAYYYPAGLAKLNSLPEYFLLLAPSSLIPKLRAENVKLVWEDPPYAIWQVKSKKQFLDDKSNIFL